MEYNKSSKLYRTEENKLKNKLQKKLEKEYQEYLDEVFKKTKNKIIESSYEITTKEKLKDELMYFQLSDVETKALLSRENLLNDLYYDWLKTDIPLGDVLIDSLMDSILKITDRFCKQQNEEELEV